MQSRLFYVMGPSGSGKDSLLQMCRERLHDIPWLVAHRYITRRLEPTGENHIYLSPAEFEKRVNLGAFAMHWQANGHRYGIGLEVDHWLERGINVLVNGSRAYLEQARARYGARLVPVLLCVETERLRQRLISRGRETSAEIAARVERARLLETELPEDVVKIDNNKDLESAVQHLLGLIREYSAPENRHSCPFL